MAAKIIINHPEADKIGVDCENITYKHFYTLCALMNRMNMAPTFLDAQKRTAVLDVVFEGFKCEIPDAHLAERDIAAYVKDFKLGKLIKSRPSTRR